MIGIVIITHGNLSQELCETVRLIMGEQKGIVPITLSAKESLETLKEKAMTAVAKFKDAACLILTDVLGGSPTNVCIDLLKSANVRILCGVNLPMVMAALQHRDSLDLNNLTIKVREGAIKGIIDLKDFYDQRAKKKES